MKNYQTPGVYIKEISAFPASVAQVETAIPAFIGFTEKGKENKLIKISNLVEFEAQFGGAHQAAYKVEVNHDPANGNVNVGQISRTSADHFYLAYAMRHFYDNGGGDCYVISIGTFKERKKRGEQAFFKALDIIAKEDEPTLIVFPDALYLDHAEYYAVVNHTLKQCFDLQDRFTILDIHGGNSKNPSDIENELKTGSQFRSSNLTAEYLKYGAVYTPYLNTTYSYAFQEENVLLSGSLTKKGTISLGDPIIQKKYPAVYLQVKALLENESVTLPPSAALAGIYSMVDNSRGVWKAPANVSVSSVTGSSVNINHQDQELLNVDANTGRSINAIRTFTGEGTLVWGARTLAGNDNEWRYVNVIRTCIMVEESVWKSSTFAVFEPNDANTWLMVRAMINNYLTDLWKQGALAGPTPESAFFVKVGLNETMTAQDIQEGRMIIEIGMAVARPAEFIILKLSHKMHQP